MKILLVAGHGAGDPGACGNGYREAEFARNVVYDIQLFLKNYADVTVFDMSKNMYQYLKSGGSYDFSSFDYILEVHFNSGGGNGTEILVHANQKGVSVEEKILKSVADIGFRNRGIKRRSDLGNMNRLFKQGKDYALLEVCFIDSISDIEIYRNNTVKIAQAVVDGIVSGFGLNNLKDTNRELTTPNDITWELSQRIEISNTAKAVEDLTRAMNENSSCYWMLRKIANKR